MVLEDFNLLIIDFIINLNDKIKQRKLFFLLSLWWSWWDILLNYLKDNLQKEIIKYIKCFEDINQYFYKII
jgi:hypothetical protein